MPSVIEHIHFKWFERKVVANKFVEKKENWQKVVSGRFLFG